MQNWFLDGDYNHVTPMQVAVTEGTAVVFEETKSGYKYDYFDFSNLDVKSLIKEVEGLGDNIDWQQWKYHHDEKDEDILLYRIGAAIAYKALEINTGISIEDLAHKTADEIRELAGV